MSFEGNESMDALDFLMAEEAQNVVEAVDVSPADVETPVDVPVMVSAPLEVAPLVRTESPNLRQEAPKVIEPAIDYEHKFKTIEGMLKAQSTESKQRLDEVSAKLEAAQVAREFAEQQLADVPVDYQNLVGDEVYEDLGEDAISGIDKMIDLKAQSNQFEMDKLKAEIANLKDGFTQKSMEEEKNAEDNKGLEHDHRVSAEVPEFLSLLKNEKFTAYLESEKDPLTGEELRTAFVSADSTYDSIIVINICKMYLASQQAIQANAYNKSEHVAPQLNSQTPVTVDKPIMKMSDYNKFADAYLKGSIDDREFDRLNNAFEIAKKEGRVQ